MKKENIFTTENLSAILQIVMITIAGIWLYGAPTWVGWIPFGLSLVFAVLAVRDYMDIIDEVFIYHSKYFPRFIVSVFGAIAMLLIMWLDCYWWRAGISTFILFILFVICLFCNATKEVF